jgi:lysophospholipase L1-like esterase
MKYLAFLGFILVFGRVDAADKDTSVLRGLIVTFFDGVAEKDYVKIGSVTTPDFVTYEFGKIWNVDSVFKNIQYHQPFTVKYTLSAARFDADSRLGEGCYHMHADFAFSNGSRAGLDLIETALFRKTPAGWKIRVIHITGIEPPMVDVPRSYQKYDTARYWPEHYQERVALFRSEPVVLGRVIFLGNSITEYGHWKEVIRDSGAVNRGIAADNTFGMLDRLGEVIARRPAKLVIEAGINDVGQGVPNALIAANIASMVAWVRVKSPGTRIFLVSVLPANADARTEYPELVGKNGIVLELDERIRQLARDKGVSYIDLASGVKDGAGDLDQRYAKPDGVHLNDAGYAIFARLWTEH